ncbi:hypothetical protein GCM10020229_14490 [Kitasatospora albolonga]|uniref:hypothetical protein n=1 Tax=Kitasatospora albolonga TaxID=68173 RepID=UPI0031E9F6B8
MPDLPTAITSFDAPAVETAVRSGSDAFAPGPDGISPLELAVGLGSPAVVLAALGQEPRLRLPASVRDRLLASARHWYEADAVEELRRRTGAEGPAEVVTVEDREWCGTVEQVTLGGSTVRSGHGAVLTLLERAFVVQTPNAELVARAVRPGDPEHVDFRTVSTVLGGRPSRRTWDEILRLRHHSSALHRLLAAEFVLSRTLLPDSDPAPESPGTGAPLEEWALTEADAEVLRLLLVSLFQYRLADPDAIAARAVAHPDAAVRAEIAWYTPTARP